MKRVLTLILVLTLIIALCACGNAGGKTPSASETPAAEPVELIIFAAASMTETLTKVAELYKTTVPNVTLTFTFDSSGTLLTQIKEGADCDVFISAAQKQMNELDIESDKNLDSPGYLLSGTRFDLVENRVVLAVAKGNPAGVASFEDVVNAASIAMGNPDVPVGQYSEEIFINMGIWDAIQDKITLGSNVKEVTSWISEGAADCGVVYSTDAAAAGLEIAAQAPEGTLKTPVLYPAAALNISKNQEEAKAFLEFLKTPAVSAVFENAGFGIPG